jgi:MFS family permease
MYSTTHKSSRLTKSGLTVGVWNLGCIVSSIMTIFISDVLGRRRTLLIGITIWTIGEIIQASSYTFSQFIVGRAVAGFGMYQLHRMLHVEYKANHHNR